MVRRWEAEIPWLAYVLGHQRQCQDHKGPDRLIAREGSFTVGFAPGPDRTANRAESPPVALDQSDTIPGFADTCLLGTVSRAEDGAFRLDTVPDHSNIADCTGWRQGVDGTFETVERVGLAVPHNLEDLIVFVAAYFAYSHSSHLLERGWSGDRT